MFNHLLFRPYCPGAKFAMPSLSYRVRVRVDIIMKKRKKKNIVHLVVVGGLEKQEENGAASHRKLCHCHTKNIQQTHSHSYLRSF